MATIEHERAARLDELEALWRLPAAAPPMESTPRWARVLAGRLLKLWLGFLGAIFVFQLAGPEPQGSTPLVADLALPGWAVLAVVGFRLLDRGRTVLSFSCAALAGAHGIAVGIACRAAEHHLGSFWLVETVGFAALTALALGGVAGASRRSGRARPARRAGSGVRSRGR